ncbi:Uncharacterised protein family (UPF0180) [Caldanaerobius fijiensis DSM 17918]|uniref:Uncharacterized protein family (UPF0180) n=1 Tax=Caldanaerobius fijiensis DSM 17918 TaxID=1121256 RepID=A0A1M5AQM4_9THEO|nr:YkuS family protein [Caldanaerobius fijiensis]SHF32466.1 Uncharacterised protein family (UPF0180) [Caldanaerobius fijiensis DSM 17918]
MLIAIDRGMEDLKTLLESQGYQVIYIDEGLMCDAYIYSNAFGQQLKYIKPGKNGTLLISGSMEYDNILNALKTRLITPLFE